MSGISSRMDAIAATTYEIEGSHLVMLFYPELVIDVVTRAAQALQNPLATSGVAGGGSSHGRRHREPAVVR